MKALKHKTKTQGWLTNVQKGMVAEIRRLYRRGEPLNISAVKRNHPKLIQRVYSTKPFWGWKCAMDAAGMDYATIKMEFEEYVICEICGKEYVHLGGHLNKCHETNLSDYRMDYPDAPGMSEAMNVEMTVRMRRGLKRKAKNVLPHWEPLWTPEYALDRLWALYQRGAPLHFSSMGVLGESSLGSYVRRHFDSWDKALKAVGLNPKEIRLCSSVDAYPNQQAVVKEIRRRHRRGWPLSPGALQQPPHSDKTLYYAAHRLWGNWPEAVEAAGLDYEKIRWKPRRKYPSADSVIQAIKRRHRRKLPLSSSGLTRSADRDKALYQSTCSFFGSWGAAIEAAGLDYESVKQSQRKYRTPTDVLRAIRKRKRQKWPLNVGGVNGRTAYADNPLYEWAVRDFGSWKEAIHAAGLDYQKIDQSHKRYPPRKYPLPQDVLNEIRRRHRLGLSLHSEVVTKHQLDANRDSTLYTSALKDFGSWRAAIEKAGIRYEDIVPRWGKYPTPDAVCKAIRRRKRLKLSLGGRAVHKDDGALYASAGRKYGNWKTAVKEALRKSW